MSKNNRASFWLAFIGAVLTLSGLVVTSAVLIYASAAADETVLAFCRVALVVGPILIGLAVVAKQRITLDAAYQFGEDIGVEKGVREERRRRRPVVVKLEYGDNDDVEVRRHPE